MIKGSDILKQLYIFIGDEADGTGLIDTEWVLDMVRQAVDKAKKEEATNE